MIAKSDKAQQVLAFATELYEQSPDWITFFRELLGVDGEVNRVFDTCESLHGFKQTGEYQQIQEMVGELRVAESEGAVEAPEPTRVITVRMPRSLHQSLRAEAHERQTSMNKLCVSKLIHVIESEFIPGGAS